MANTVYVNVSGTWKEADAYYVNVNGTWKTGTEFQARVSSEWKGGTSAAVGDGLKLTQIRLGTARLTHCMRWLGLAKRSMEVASEYVEQRESFHIKLADRESVQMMLGGLAADIELGRLITMRAAWKLANGDFARKEVSMAKNHVADTLHRAVDTALQLNGARGYSKDTPLEWIYRYARQARLVDGASEVHKMVLSRIYRDEGLNFWSWGV